MLVGVFLDLQTSFQILKIISMSQPKLFLCCWQLDQIYILGNQQKMSFNLLPFDNDESVREFPPAARIPNTLILIQTMKNLSMNSFGWNDNQELQQPVNHYDTNSFEISLECQKNSSTSRPQSVKKKTGCTCKKTKCLKRYCQCFDKGRQCTPECSCYNCFNISDYQKIVDKARLDLKAKGSRKNGKGCICKKSHCQKKYCECFRMGLPCTQACRCLDCQNTQKGEEVQKQNQQDKISNIANISKYILYEE